MDRKISQFNTATPVAGFSFIPFYSTQSADVNDKNKKVDPFNLPISTPVQNALNLKADTTALSGKLSSPASAGVAGQALFYTSGGPVWGDIPSSGGGSGSTSSTPVTLADAATVTPNASAGDYFVLQAGTTATRAINKPTGMESGKAKKITILFKQDSVGGRAVTFGSNIEAFGGVDARPNAVTIISLVTVDGGNNWIADGLGVSPGNDKYIGTDASANPVALDNVRSAYINGKGTPDSTDSLTFLIAPFAGKIRSLRSFIATGSMNLTVKIGSTNVGGLAALARANTDTNSVAPTSANTFAVGDRISLTVNSATSLTGTWCVALDVVPTA